MKICAKVAFFIEIVCIFALIMIAVGVLFPQNAIDNLGLSCK